MNKIYTLLLIILTAANSNAFGQDVYFINKTKVKVFVSNWSSLQESSALEIQPSVGKVQAIKLPTNNNAVYNIGIAKENEGYGTNLGKYYLLKPNDTIVLVKVKTVLKLIHHSSPQRTKELEMGEKLLSGVSIKPFYLLNLREMIRLNAKNQPFSKRDFSIDSLSIPIIKYIDSFSENNQISSQILEQYKFNYIGMWYFTKLFVLSNDAIYKKAFADHYRDSALKWTKKFTCNNCGNIPFYNHAAKNTFDLAFDKLPPEEHLRAIADHAEGKTKDFLLSAYVNDQIAATSPQISTLIPLYQSLCHDSIYKKTIADNYLILSSGNISHDSSIGLLSDKKTKSDLNDVIRKHKGKVLYIDFWASWCVPCLAEMPFSTSLKIKLRDNNKIKLLYISIDRDYDSWVKMQNKSQLDIQSSYILTSSGKAKLSKQIDLNTIPRYLIIDKNGNFINRDADRPSSKKIYSELTSLSNK